MGINLKGRCLLTLKDFTLEEIKYLLGLAREAKKDSRAGVVHQRFLGKNLAMLFEKRSTRTRCAFEAAFGEEGGNPVFLSKEDIQLGDKESVEDTARVLEGCSMPLSLGVINRKRWRPLPNIPGYRYTMGLPTSTIQPRSLPTY